MGRNPRHRAKGYSFRYAYWIEDLSGRIDGKNAGTIPPDKRLSTAELDYATIFDPAADAPVIPPELVAKRGELRTPASVRSVLDAEQAKRIEPYLYFLDPPASPGPPKIIPQGFGYADAGKPAHDLNELVSNADVDGIADIINRNLPDFKDRKGGFPDSQDYVKTLAASIIDYADADSDATTGGDYRGVDSYPFVNELFDRYEWVSSPEGSVKIDVDTYLELWNPSDQSISGDIGFKNINKRKIKLGANGTKDFSEAEYGPISVNIPPNGFRVIHLGKKTETFDVDLEPAEPLTFNADDSDSSFELSWNGKLVDYPRSGVERTYSLMRAGLSERRWKGNSSPANDMDIGQYGDPRASYYSGDFFQKSDYGNNSNWGGRVIKRKLSNDKPFREVRLEQWPDRGSNSTLGVASGTDARVPTDTRIILKSSGAPIADKEFPPNQPDLAPARISNAGEYESLGELGNIFDPAQWSDVEKPSASANAKSGGGITLAVGRPEFAAFDREGRYAAQLLDLFSLGRSALPAPDFAPININTAPREVLRSLIAGIALDDDPVADTLEIARKSTDPTIGDIFADQVIAYRTSRPMRSVSDLNLVREKPLIARDYSSPVDQPFFGNPENFINVPHVPERTDPSLEYDQAEFEEWNDAGREELFKKVMELVSYKSNKFRIVIAGELISPSGKPAARSVREYHIGIFPERDAVGNIIPDAPLTIRKYYEKTL